MFNEHSISAKTRRKILRVFLRRVTQKNLAPTGPMVGEETEGSKKSIYKTATRFCSNFVPEQFKSLFFEPERILINFAKKMIFGHILAVKVLLTEIWQNKKLMNIEMVKNKAYK